VAVINTVQVSTSPSYLFSDVSVDLKNKLSKGQGIVYFNHHYAITSDYYNGNSQLKNFWNVVGTTTSSFNEEFLSIVEAKDYPFYGVQFHP